MRHSRIGAATALLCGLALLAGCTEDAEKMRRTPERTVSPSASAAPSGETTATGEPTETGSGEQTEAAAEPEAELPRVRTPYSLPALMAETPGRSTIRRLRVSVDNEAYTEWEVRYRSGDIWVSGVLLVPKRKGPLPGVVLAHGYIEPSIYVTGQGLSREQDHLARNGFVVLHTDYRGHASSDPATALSRETRIGYTRDVVNAVMALRSLDKVDEDRLALLGRSMGGGVTYNALVAQPGLVDAAVVFAPVSSDFLDNLRRWTLPERPEAAQRLFRRFGTPQESPGFYDGLSARTWFDRITEPVLIHHGTLDDSCPLPWSRTTHRLLRRAGVDSTLRVYEGEQHAFGPQWLDSMRLTVRFLRRHLDG